MRGTDEASGSLFSYVDLEARIPARHPLRTIRSRTLCLKSMLTPTTYAQPMPRISNLASDPRHRRPETRQPPHPRSPRAARCR